MMVVMAVIGGVAAAFVLGATIGYALGKTDGEDAERERVRRELHWTRNRGRMLA